MLQTGYTGERLERLERENSTINYTLDKPGSERHATRNRLSFAYLRDRLPSLESIRVFFMMLIFGTPTFSHHQKILLCVFFGVVIVSAAILASVVYFSERWRSAAAASERERLPRQMDPREWAEAVNAYRRVMTGKNSRTVIRGSSVPQPAESAILKSAIAQAEIRDAAAAASSSHGGKKPGSQAAAGTTASELRAQAAMARQSNASDLDNCSSTGVGNMQVRTPSTLTPTTEEEAEWLGMMHSIDDDDHSLDCLDHTADQLDHHGPTACTFFRNPR